MLLVSALALAAQCPAHECSGEPAGCPSGASKRVSKPAFPRAHEHLYFRNEAPFGAELLYVNQEGHEESMGAIAPQSRRMIPTLQGDFWRARAIRPGRRGDRRLLLEHAVGPVVIKDCECPPREYVDCSRPRPVRDPNHVYDPVLFENRGGVPVDLFYWNGTCEELTTWNLVGGMQVGAQAPVQSKQGHAFRLRSADPSRRLLFAHTLSDLVLRDCARDDEPERGGAARDGLGALRGEVEHFAAERDRLRETLASELHRMLLALGGGNRSAASGGAGTAGGAAAGGAGVAEALLVRAGVQGSGATGGGLW